MKISRWMVLLVMVALVALTVNSAFAYFSSQRETTGTITAGTLTLKLSSNDVDYLDTVALPWNISNLAPGDKVSGKIFMKNVGTIAAKQVTFEWTNVIDNPSNFADHVFLTGVYDSMDSNPAAVLQQFTDMADGIVDGNKDGQVSLRELATLSTHYGFTYDAASSVPFLAANGGTAWLYMEFTLDPALDNTFQAAGLDYGLIINAHQNQVFP